MLAVEERGDWCGGWAGNRGSDTYHTWHVLAVEERGDWRGGWAGNRGSDTYHTWHVLAVEEHVSAVVAGLGRRERHLEHGAADLLDVVRQTAARRRRTDADLHAALARLRHVHCVHNRVQTSAVADGPARRAASFASHGSVPFCSLAVFDPRVGHTIWTYFPHLSMSSVILIDSSTESPVHVLMLSIQAVRGLPCGKKVKIG